MLAGFVAETFQQLTTGIRKGRAWGHCVHIGTLWRFLEDVGSRRIRYSGTYCLLCEGFPSRPAGRPGGIMSAL